MPSRPLRSAADSGQAALDWAAQTVDADRLVAEVEAHAQKIDCRRRNTAISVFAALLIVGFAGYFLRPVAVAPAVIPLSARVTHPDTQMLPDGSVIELKEGARVTVDYTLTARRVTLIAGEAHFQVEKNRTRPFIVNAGGVEVRAVGTAFLVQLDTRSVEVVVNEGIVAIDPPAQTNSPARPQVMVAAGHSVAVNLAAAESAAVPVAALSETVLNQRLAWRVPRLEFNRTPLVEALPLFNQHSPDVLRLTDPALGHLELSGVIRADDTESLLLLLKNEFGITAETRGHEIVLWR